MKAISSEEYERCMLIAKEAMTPYFLDNDLDWDDQQRTSIYKTCDLYLVNDNEEVGFFMLREKEGNIFLADVHILEKHRNRGYGTRILELAKKMAFDRGYSTIWLKVFRDNPALGLYYRNGYALKIEEEFVYVLSANTEQGKPPGAK